MVGAVAVPATRASRALAQVQCTQTEIGRRVGVSQVAVSGWVNLQARPEAHHRKALDRVYGIPENDWMTDSEHDLAIGAT